MVFAMRESVSQNFRLAIYTGGMGGLIYSVTTSCLDCERALSHNTIEMKLIGWEEGRRGPFIAMRISKMPAFKRLKLRCFTFRFGARARRNASNQVMESGLCVKRNVQARLRTRWIVTDISDDTAFDIHDWMLREIRWLINRYYWSIHVYKHLLNWKNDFQNSVKFCQKWYERHANEAWIKMLYIYI